MEIITSLEAVKTEYSPSVIALGTFDGLHLGHQDIIKQHVIMPKSMVWSWLFYIQQSSLILDQAWFSASANYYAAAKIKYLEN